MIPSCSCTCICHIQEYLQFMYNLVVLVPKLPCIYLSCIIKADKSSPVWQFYLDYVDDMIVDGLRNSILCSMQYLLVNTERGTGRGPLLECKMELQAPVITFLPNLDQVNGAFSLAEVLRICLCQCAFFVWY